MGKETSDVHGIFEKHAYEYASGAVVNVSAAVLLTDLIIWVVGIFLPRITQKYSPSQPTTTDILVSDAPVGFGLET